ncbi:hypothetical protein HPB50_002247 [Hyalomma asiaticum]|uniref:Uncharacterized protein n=1 Tax=Hyalomma asiaticum TaxID=266040 RepID=A0ACB7TAZ3_HYAAI|nr:hypothetical protein HPB50_002247 [Hyalomma asiaticum]
MRGQAREPCGQIGQKRLRRCIHPAGLSPPSNCYSGANTDGPLAAHKEDSKGADCPTPLSLSGQPSRLASISPVSQQAASDRRRRRRRNANAQKAAGQSGSPSQRSMAALPIAKSHRRRGDEKASSCFTAILAWTSDHAKDQSRCC